MCHSHLPAGTEQPQSSPIWAPLQGGAWPPEDAAVPAPLAEALLGRKWDAAQGCVPGAWERTTAERGRPAAQCQPAASQRLGQRCQRLLSLQLKGPGRPGFLTAPLCWRGAGGGRPAKRLCPRRSRTFCSLRLPPGRPAGPLWPERDTPRAATVGPVAPRGLPSSSRCSRNFPLFSL